MKRIFILVVVALLAGGMAFADESVLIDFTKLTADGEPDADGKNTQNNATVKDFSDVAGANVTDDQKAAMKSSLAIENWEVVLASSSRNVTNKALSYTLESDSKANGKVMGVRIHFPVERFNSWALIKPPFEIPAFDPPAAEDDADAPANDGVNTSRFDGNGVIRNVGTIKAVAANVYGLNFPHHLSMILIDARGNEQVIPLGFLNFDGWAQLTWNNPTYVQDVRQRELRLYSLYPDTAVPFVKFGGFLVQKDAASVGGDFIGYFKDISIIYDKATLDTERDIDDESLWHIVRDRESTRDKGEMDRFGQRQVQRYLDQERQAKPTDTFFSSQAAGDEDQQ
jgi:hypothetical protein